MAAAGLAVSDYQYAFYVNSFGPSSTAESINDLDRRNFGATPNESVADARRRFILANFAGTSDTDSLADLERRWYSASLGNYPASTNQDLEYNVYLSLAP